MTKRVEYFLIGAVCCVISAFMTFVALRSGTEAPVRDEPAKSSRKARLARDARRAAREKQISETKIVEVKQKPNFLAQMEAEEEAKLTQFEREILKELQAALDAEDFKAVTRLVERIQHPLQDKASPFAKSSEFHEKVLHAAIESLAWFGGDGLPELTGFLAEENDDVRQYALDQFEQALCDMSLSDYDRAPIIVMASQVLTDGDALDQIFMEINNSRHTVGASIIKEICETGTPEAKSKMPEVIEFYTGEDNIQTVEDLENWVVNNPDGPDDDDLYGGMEE